MNWDSRVFVEPSVPTSRGLRSAQYGWLFMLVLLTGPTTYAADSKSGDAQEISRIEKEWCEAIERRNRKFFARYLADGFTYINEDGLSQGRDAFVEPMMESPSIIEVSISDQKVALHGATAVVTGRFTVKNGADIVTSLYTNVFAKGPDGWKAVALHETRAK